MIAVDYFLEEKVISKNLPKLKNQTYRSIYPITSKTKFRWAFEPNFVGDRFCFDYLQAYKFERIDNTKLYDDLKYFEIVALAATNGQVEDQNLNKLFDKLTKLNTGGYKALTYDEKLLLNLSEVYDLISQQGFPLNKENFELFIHILFRNLVYDLDIVDSYIRNENTKTSFKHTIDNRLLLKELDGFWNKLEEDETKTFDYTGITKAFLLGLEMLYISPYDRFNLIIMSFVVKWYLFQLDDEFRSLYFALMILMDYKDFIEIADKALKSSNIDEYLKIMRVYCEKQLNFSKRIEWVSKHIEKHRSLKELKQYENLFYVVYLMGFGDEDFSINMVLKKMSKRSFKITKEEIQEKLDLFHELKIIKKNEKNETYYISNLDFKKYALLFKD